MPLSVFSKKKATSPSDELVSEYAPLSGETDSKANFRELRRLLWSGVALVFLLSLLSYSPTDPSFSTWTTHTQFQNWLGRLGSILSDVLLQLFGLGGFFFCLFLFLVALKIETRKFNLGSLLSAGAVFLIAISSLLQIAVPRSLMPWHFENPGGILGKAVSESLIFLTGALGTSLICIFLLVASSLILFKINLVALGAVALKELPRKIKNAFAEFRKNLTPKKAPPVGIATNPVQKAESLGPTFTPPVSDEELSRMVAPRHQKAPKEKISKTRPKGKTDFELPQLAMLSGKAESKVKPVDKNWYLEKGNILVQKLRDFGVEGEVVHISPGPVITVYEFKPASGVKIKEIANLSDDLTLALSVLSVRIVAPIPGKPVVGIEIPSPHREMVFFKDMIEETSFYNADVRIPIVLGRLASGEPVITDLASMPHLLVAGSTGTGKSVFINSLICSLLYRYTPTQLKLILVDPKMVELSGYENIPHLLLPVVVDSKKAAMALRWTVEEMERRYTLMHEFGVRHVDAYNEKLNELRDEVHKYLPYIVVVIDEYADLMAVVPKDVELSISRLAQKARASGIHLVLATQRPSTDVVTGTIKANFPSRISFRVASSVDSKTILDRAGAERLLGHGDLLFHSAGFMSLKRMQGAFISDIDINKVVTHLKSQGEPEYDENILLCDESELSETEDSETKEGNELFDAAVRIVSEKGEASISLLQRHLKIGYNRAATLMEELEKQGIVAESTGTSKRRSVLVNSL